MHFNVFRFLVAVAPLSMSLITNSGFSQDSLKSVERPALRTSLKSTQNRWEVGYELLPLVSGSFPQEFVLKLHSRRNNGQALRLRVGLDSYTTIARSSRFVSAAPSNIKVPRTYNQFGGHIRFGTERNKSFGKLGLIYGVDLIAQHAKTYDESADGTNPNLSYVNTALNDEIGLSPLLGVKYRFTPRISLSLEATLNLVYNVQQTTNQTLSRDIQIQLIEQKGRVFYYYLSPLKFLYLSAYF